MQEVYASWLLLKYLTTSVPFQADFSRVSGYIPVIRSVDQDEIYSKFLGSADGGDYISALSTKVALEQEKAYFVSPAFVGSSVARDQAEELLNKCLGFTEDNGSIADQIKSAFEDAVEECEYQN